jgi:Carboxypeptidase regulatory-like domain
MKLVRCWEARLLGVVLLLFAVAGSAKAQGNTADIIGIVTDTSGAVVPGATVTLTNLGTNASQTATTNFSGDYIFTLVQVGSYSVSVKATGFKTFVASNVTVAAGDRARVNAQMAVGNLTETVQVDTAATPALQTDSAALSTLVTEQAVQDIPLDGRNVVKLIQLSAGTTAGSPGSIIGGTRPDDRRQTSAFSVNGQTDSANNELIDGLDDNERIIGGIGVRPSVEAIEEVNVQTNSYSAEFGRTAGGVVNLVTKSGTNSFHGTAFEFFRNKVLNANPNHQFPTGSPADLTGFVAKPPFRQNQYGGSLGGPIKKNKTFFFGDYEQEKQAKGIRVNDLAVPTLCERGSILAHLQGYKGPAVTCPDGKSPTRPGDFSDSPSVSAPGGSDFPCDGLSGDPVYGSPACPYVVLDPTKFDRQGLEMFSLYPLPTIPGLFNNFSTAPTRTQDSKTFDVRIDHHFSDKDTFFARYSFNNLDTVTPDAFPPVMIDTTTGMPAASGVKVYPSAPGSNAPMSFANAFPGPNFERQQGLGLSYVHVFSPNVIVALRAGYLKSSIKSVGPNYGSTVSNKLGFPCNAVQCMNLPPNLAGSAQSSGLAGVNFDADITAGSGGVTTPDWTDLGDVSALPLLEFDNSYQYMGEVTWNKGNHSIKIGVGVIRRQASIDQSMASDGEIYFDGIYTGEQGGDLLYGLSRGNSTSSADGWRNISLVAQQLRSWEPSAFIQDDWRARKWLTINLGLRYDIFTPYTEKHGRFSNFDQSLGLFVSPSFPGAQNAIATDGINTYYKNIAPRFGFAATLPHNMVVRGGFGLTFFPTNYGSGYAGKNAPYISAISCQTQVNVAPAQQPSPPCVAPFADSAVANYGPPPGDGLTSFVGQSGGAQLSQGLPVPTINFAVVQAPAGCNTPNPGANPNPSSPAILPAACTTQQSSIAPNGNPYVGITSNNLIPFNFPTAYLEQANLMVQKEIGNGNVVTLGWVGEFGHRASRQININSFSNPNQQQLPQTAQFPWLNSAGLGEQEDIANNAYNALQAVFVRRFNAGLTVNFNYTWAHGLGTFQSCQPLPASIGHIAATIPCYYDNVANPASPIVVSKLTGAPFSWGNTALDIQNRFNWAFDYELPFGKTLTGVEGAILKGWTINSGGSWQSGLPFTVTESANLTGTQSTGYPDKICSGKLSNPTLFEWWNPACFKPQTANTFGNEVANTLYGPPQRSLDASLFKDFKLTEALKMQFRVEIFNLFNTPNFAVPSRGGARVSFTNGGTGVPKAPASSQITAITLGANPREVQLAVKFLF